VDISPVNAWVRLLEDTPIPLIIPTTPAQVSLNIEPKFIDLNGAVQKIQFERVRACNVDWNRCQRKSLDWRKSFNAQNNLRLYGCLQSLDSCYGFQYMQVLVDETR
jgi:hypothetical protein